MSIILHNPYSGRKSTGFRFCFHVRAIAHQPLFLPLAMKSLPKIQSLLKGESPLTVFNCGSLSSARLAFSELRKMFDFPYWAAKEFHIRDIDDADNIVPLRLNYYQHHIIDIFQKRYHNHQPSRYIITKSFSKCGVTTCVQAYIIWQQTYRCFNNSFTCSSSEINLFPLKADLCRFLHRDIVPPNKWIYSPKADRKAFFNTFRSPDFIRGINLGYVHFADMSKWKDPEGILSSRTFSAATSAVLLEYFTLVVLEGNIPRDHHYNITKYRDFTLPLNTRIRQFKPFSSNPFFLDHVAYACNKPDTSYFLHINLDPLKNTAPQALILSLQL